MKKYALHIVYIPGLGDGYESIRSTALKFWRRADTKVSFAPIRWSDDTESYSAKRKRILQIINSVDSREVMVIGESAGGSMALNVADSLDTMPLVVTIFGKNRYAERVSPVLYRKNPAFKDSMYASDKVLKTHSEHDRSRITVIRSPFDPVIHKKDTVLDGAKIKRLYTPGHLVSIFLVLTLLWPLVIKWGTR